MISRDVMRQISSLIVCYLRCNPITASTTVDYNSLYNCSITYILEGFEAKRQQTAADTTSVSELNQPF